MEDICNTNEAVIKTSDKCKCLPVTCDCIRMIDYEKSDFGGFEELNFNNTEFDIHRLNKVIALNTLAKKCTNIKRMIWNKLNNNSLTGVNDSFLQCKTS